MATDERNWARDMGLDRLPHHIVDKRVTDLMNLSGKKAICTGAGGDGLGHAIANRLAAATIEEIGYDYLAAKGENSLTLVPRIRDALKR